MEYDSKPRGLVSIPFIENYSSTMIAAAEYYIDTDPGLGNGTPIEAADGSFDGTLEDIDFNVIGSELGIGVHRISVRFQDAEGTWSIAQHQDVTVSNPFIENYSSTMIAAAEYYMTQIRSLGNGTPIEAADGSFDGTLEDIDFNVIGSELGIGVHRISVRFKTQRVHGV